tara:strand:+ start:5830 stop:7059 length:1230 start_codon:yes stop_codon:yes gene_type:complete
MNKIIKGKYLIDGNGGKPKENSAVIIEDGKIKDITDANNIPKDGYEILDYPNSTIMPGLIEVHTHMHVSPEPGNYEAALNDSDTVLAIRATDAVRKTLMSGVTTMRDIGSKNHIAFPVRDAVDAGIIPGPRMLLAGQVVTTTAGHCNYFGTEADTLDEAVTAARANIKLGAEWIKIMSTGGGFTPRSNMRAAQYPAETLEAVVNDAERLGAKVCSHAHGTVGVVNCVKAGMHNIIHCSWLAEDPEKAFDYKEDVADEIAEKGIYVDATLATGYMRTFRDPEFSPAEAQKMGFNAEERVKILQDMRKRGVKFVSGIDSGMLYVRFDDIAYTPERMVEVVDMGNMEAIVACTKTSAECLQVDDETGTIDKNKSADIIVVEGNPNDDIKALHNVRSVMLRGKLVKDNGIELV